MTLAGQPQYEPIDDTGLLGVANTDSDLFEDPAQNLHYVLISGRWFRTAALRGGTWEHVPGRALPPGFARIPADSRYGRVLAHVPGTPAAAEAVADARVPQTAAVRRDATITITYDGEPQFEPIAGTSLAYAVNSPSQVLRTADGQYYDCTQGVWYRSASATGPWVVSTTVPAEVASIPPGSPAYNLRYAYVYDSTDEAVYVGYAPGYLGTYVFDGVVVWGTGFSYRGWWHHHYYPHPWTYGFGMAYNPWTGHWGSGFRGGRRGGWPAEGTVGFHGGWLGPAGYHAAFTPRSVRAGTAWQRQPGALRPGGDVPPAALRQPLPRPHEPWAHHRGVRHHPADACRGDGRRRRPRAGGPARTHHDRPRRWRLPPQWQRLGAVAAHRLGAAPSRAAAARGGSTAPGRPRGLASHACRAAAGAAWGRARTSAGRAAAPAGCGRSPRRSPTHRHSGGNRPHRSTRRARARP